MKDDGVYGYNEERFLDMYKWANIQYNDTLKYSTGFTQLLLESPISVGKDLYNREFLLHKTIQEFQDICLSILKDAIKTNDTELLKWLLNEVISGYSLEYHKNLKGVFYTKPVFFRTDEMSLEKIAEIQCPGSLWGELELLYNFHKSRNFVLPKFSPAEIFATQLKDFLNGEDPVIQYLTDNASAPPGVHYFIQQTRPFVKYWGIDKGVRAMNCNFIRSHSFYGLCGENYFKTRLQQENPRFKFDLPPHILFDQKATLVLPFWKKTRHLFSDKIRNMIVYSTPLIDEQIELEEGEMISISNFSKLPQSRRNYYLKYAGSDVSINWGSKAVYRLSNYGSGKCLELLQSCLSDFQYGKIWLLQKELTESAEISYYDRTETRCLDKFNAKYSSFFGPAGLIGIVASYRKHFKVHGQEETVVGIMVP